MNLHSPTHRVLPAETAEGVLSKNVLWFVHHSSSNFVCKTLSILRKGSSISPAGMILGELAPMGTPPGAYSTCRCHHTHPAASCGYEGPLVPSLRDGWPFLAAPGHPLPPGAAVLMKWINVIRVLFSQGRRGLAVCFNGTRSQASCCKGQLLWTLCSSPPIRAVVLMEERLVTWGWLVPSLVS